MTKNSTRKDLGATREGAEDRSMKTKKYEGRKKKACDRELFPGPGFRGGVRVSGLSQEMD